MTVYRNNNLYMNMEAIFAVINTTCSEIRLQKKIQACTGFEPLIKFGFINGVDICELANGKSF